MRFNSSISITLLIISAGTLALSGNPKVMDDARAFPFAPISLDAADSVLARLDDHERIAQLFVIRGVDSTAYGCSGYIDAPGKKIGLLRKNDRNGIPYFYGQDLIQHGDSFYSESQLAGTNNLGLVSKYAETIGENLHETGHNFVIGPSLEVLYNDQNPHTMAHSFSDDPEVVLENARAFVSGMKKAGIQSVVGSYPGIGNMNRGFDQDSPIVYSRMNQLERVDMVPFKGLINEGIQGILVANAAIPAVDSNRDAMASSSHRIHKLLHDKLGFNGLVWCDLTTSKSDQSFVNATNYLVAGNDVVIISGDLNTQVKQIQKSIRLGIISQEEIDRKCKRVIQAKLWMRQSEPRKTTEENNQIQIELREREIVQASLTLLRNVDFTVPIQALDTTKIAVVKIGNEGDVLDPYLVNRYSPADVFDISFSELEKGYAAFQKRESDYNIVIILANPEAAVNRKRFGMSEHYQSVIERIGYSQRTILVWNGNPKGLLQVISVPSIAAIISGHKSGRLTDDFALQAVFGGRPISGRLKRKLGVEFMREAGIETKKTRLAYGIPEEVGVRSEFLVDIDKIAYSAITEKACPGSQVWFAKDGMVVVDNTYGYHTYQRKDTVKPTDLYDLASITKIAGSVAGMMKLSQDSLFNLDHNLCDYLSEWVDTTAYMNMGMREIFSHQAGLPAFIPFYAKTLRKGVPRFDVYSLAQNDIYSHRVARELYIHKDQPDKMFRQILRHPIKSQKKYKYSDVGYYFALRIIEKQSGMKMEDYLDQVYYKPLGLSTMTYRPLKKFDKKQIAPTEYDRYFRNQLVHGDVHDPGAAMLGGVGGHAGLFSNANDLGVLMQMYLNGGSYGGNEYFDSSIIADFVQCQFCDNDNRRGAGFDKPLTDGSSGPSCGCTDLNAFGHQGFTGTVTWADPRDQVVYVFLSNRVYPDASNKKLAHMNIRTDIQQVFHDAIIKSAKADSAANQL